jgi:DNA primase small subunit
MFIFNEKFDEENSIIRWKLLLHFAEHGTVSGVDKMIKKMIFEKLYPKLDENVSIKKSHLLKAPFSIHPGTGNICVPILDIENAQLETLLQLNLNNIIHNHKSDLLLPYIQIFTEKAEQQ